MLWSFDYIEPMFLEAIFSFLYFFFLSFFWSVPLVLLDCWLLQHSPGYMKQKPNSLSPR